MLLQGSVLLLDLALWVQAIWKQSNIVDFSNEHASLLQNKAVSSPVASNCFSLPRTVEVTGILTSERKLNFCRKCFQSMACSPRSLCSFRRWLNCFSESVKQKWCSTCRNSKVEIVPVWSLSKAEKACGEETSEVAKKKLVRDDLIPVAEKLMQNVRNKREHATCSTNMQHTKSCKEPCEFSSQHFMSWLNSLFSLQDYFAWWEGGLAVYNSCL